MKNIGQRPAFDVSITLDPPPERASDRGGHEIAAAKMFNEPVAMIAPDQELRTFYDNQAERSDREDLPTSHQVSLTYRDSSGQSYSEMSVLDLEALKGTMSTSIKTLHDIGKILEKMQKTLQRASLLQQSGSIEVGASIEARDAKVQRLNEARAEQQEKHRHIVEKLTPEKTGETQTEPDASHQEDASDC